MREVIEMTGKEKLGSWILTENDVVHVSTIPLNEGILENGDYYFHSQENKLTHRVIQRTKCNVLEKGTVVFDLRDQKFICFCSLKLKKNDKFHKQILSKYHLQKERTNFLLRSEEIPKDVDFMTYTD